uniref:hypothetical protein n=1 Tax=Shewanella gaetbuli TaxID=220752 RepID=UPI003B59F11D
MNMDITMHTLPALQHAIQSSVDEAGDEVEKFQPYLLMPMRYFSGVNNNQIGKARRELTIKIVARFGLTSPTIIAWLYGISQRQAIEHLNKLVKEKLLNVVVTHRSLDNRVYVLDYAGAKYAEELLSVAVYFRSGDNPSLRVNLNTVMHDLIMEYILLRGVHNVDKEGNDKSYWHTFVTEPEFKRLFKSTDVRNVDGIALEPNGVITAIEIEHSFKTKAARQTILLKWLYGLSHGYYDKVMLFSQSQQVFNDIKRLHNQLFEEMSTRVDKKTRQPLLRASDVDVLQSRIIYRTVFCHELDEMFYQ